jgi:hypothetical protein
MLEESTTMLSTGLRGITATEPFAGGNAAKTPRAHNFGNPVVDNASKQVSDPMKCTVGGRPRSMGAADIRPARALKTGTLGFHLMS